MNRPTTLGIHHLGLTVSDVDKTVDFLSKQLNFIRVGDDPDYPATFVSDGTVMLTIWRASKPDQCRPFDRYNNVGLHHFALRVADFEALEELHQQLSQQSDVAIEFCPEPLHNTDYRHMMCTIPGGLRVEFIAD
jgi:catechol 2,3-dioxygenase-like lactoylglutathione lyase family enzyme